jgi:hypothetical protein
MKLRKVIRATGLAVLAILGGCDTQVDEPYLVELLFVQHANSVVLENGQLILEGISRDVLYFSDRPERIVGREPVEVFVDAWDDGEESFEVIPPNAILTVVTDGKPLDLAVVLKNPVLSGYSMIYDVEVLVGPDSGRGGKAALFIDAFGMELGRPGRPGLGAEPGIPGAEVGRPGRGAEPGIPGAEPGRPGRPGMGAEPGIPGGEPGRGGHAGGRSARGGARDFHGGGGLDRRL